MANDSMTRSQGKQVAGLYRLGAVIGRSAEGEVYETEFGDDSKPAVIKIRRGDTPDAEMLMQRWQHGIELSHPNLIRVYAAGSSVLHDVPVVYVVMEKAEESLAGVLQERALSEAETREMLTALLAGLRYLHKNGYAHGSLKPSNILALGDTLKLSSDSATRVEDGGDAGEDVRALGTIIVKALTQKLPRQEENGVYILREASQPFTDIVRKCLDPDPDKRWTVDQVQARLNRPELGPVEVPPNAPAGKVPDAEAIADHDGPRGGVPKWIYGALVALVLVVVAVALVRRKDSGPAPASPAPVAVAENSGSSIPPDAIAPAPVVTEAPKVVKPSPTGRAALPGAKHGAKKGDGWSVIAAAYGSRDAAEKRKQAIARKWPKFNLDVYEQDEGKGYYLVELGHNLTEEEAEALRKRAVAAGLPRDTYIKNFGGR